jgi:hypothetical protein
MDRIHDVVGCLQLGLYGVFDSLFRVRQCVIYGRLRFLIELAPNASTFCAAATKFGSPEFFAASINGAMPGNAAFIISDGLDGTSTSGAQPHKGPTHVL